MNGQGLDLNLLFLIAGCGGGCTVSHFLLGRFLSDVCEGDPIATCSDDLQEIARILLPVDEQTVGVGDGLRPSIVLLGVVILEILEELAVSFTCHVFVIQQAGAREWVSEMG